MNTKTNLTRAVAIGFFSIFLALAWGCEQGAEGDRCNPDLSHDECHAGLSCQEPPNCPENYCCATDGTSTSPFCQPGCNGGLASICTADPADDACSDASPEAASSADAGAGADAGSPEDSGVGDARDAETKG